MGRGALPLTTSVPASVFAPAWGQQDSGLAPWAAWLGGNQLDTGGADNAHGAFGRTGDRRYGVQGVRWASDSMAQRARKHRTERRRTRRWHLVTAVLFLFI